MESKGEQRRKMVPRYVLWATGNIFMLLTHAGDLREEYESGGEKESW